MDESKSIYQTKWSLFSKRIWLFRFIPFVDFVSAAGSLATGTTHVHSDFDVLVGARQGRIFTARFASLIYFRLFGWARKKHDTKESARDKICLNHFVTPSAYHLAPPYNAYWKHLYQSLVPVYGASEKIQEFFDANQDWMGEKRIYAKDKPHVYEKGNWIQSISESILSGTFGDWIEKKLKIMQMNRIQKGFTAEAGYKPRLICNDNELEFHPDTKRTENYV